MGLLLLAAYGLAVVDCAADHRTALRPAGKPTTSDHLAGPCLSHQSYVSLLQAQPRPAPAECEDKDWWMAPDVKAPKAEPVGIDLPPQLA